MFQAPPITLEGVLTRSDASCDAWRSERNHGTAVADRCADERPIRFCDKSGERACEELNLEDKGLIGSTAYNALKAWGLLTPFKTVPQREEASDIEMEADDTIAMKTSPRRRLSSAGT